MISREQVRDLVESKLFQRFILVAIIYNAVILGLATSPRVTAELNGFLHTASQLALGIFIVELIARIYAHESRFFADPWNVLDLLVVSIALTPVTGVFSVLRLVRLLRVLRLMSAAPAMRRVVNALLAAIPGFVSIVVLLSLIIYTSALLATHLFRHAAPEYFDGVESSAFTLFQILTSDGWPDVARRVMEVEPTAWIAFVAFTALSVFAILNLFTGLIISALIYDADTELAEAVEARVTGVAASRQLLLAEVRALRVDVAELRAQQDR